MSVIEPRKHGAGSNQPGPAHRRVYTGAQCVLSLAGSPSGLPAQLDLAKPSS